MTEPTEKTEEIIAQQRRQTVQVDAWSKNWLIREAHNRWMLTGKKTTENEIIRELIETYAEKPVAIRIATEHNIRSSERLEKLVSMLIGFYTRAMESGHEQFTRGLRAIEHNIEWFYGSIGDPDRVKASSIEFIIQPLPPAPRAAKPTPKKHR